MNKNKIYITLDMNLNEVKPVVLKQYNKDSQLLIITVTENGKQFLFDDNMICHFKMITPDHRPIFNKATISSNTVTVEITESCCICPGIGKAELDIIDTSEETMIATMNMNISIQESVYDNSVVESAPEFSALTKLVTENKNMNDRLNKLHDDITDAETVRSANEEKRISNEDSRNAAETTRSSNEYIRISNENTRISSETARNSAESMRVQTESERQKNTAAAIVNTNDAAKRANEAADDLQSKLDSHHFVLTEDKDTANGVPGLDVNAKVPLSELYEATTSRKGITQLTDGVTSTSTTTAATPNSVKTAYDSANTERNRAIAAEQMLSDSLSDEISRATGEETKIKTEIVNGRPIWEDKYTRNEIDNKFSTLETAIDWKESVDTYDDITSAYPNPQDGWTVNVKDTDYTYRWNGGEWIVISANAIPKATQDLDGLLSKEDKQLYDDANKKKHVHANKSVLDKITRENIDEWNMVNNKVNQTDLQYKGLTSYSFTDDGYIAVEDNMPRTLASHFDTIYGNFGKFAGEIDKKLSADGTIAAETAVEAQNIKIRPADAIDTELPILLSPEAFAGESQTGMPQMPTNDLKYNPSTKTLTVENIKGTVTDATTAYYDENGARIGDGILKISQDL